MIAFDTPFISKKLTKIQETIQQPKYLSVESHRIKMSFKLYFKNVQGGYSLA